MSEPKVYLREWTPANPTRITEVLVRDKLVGRLQCFYGTEWSAFSRNSWDVPQHTPIGDNFPTREDALYALLRKVLGSNHPQSWEEIL